MRAAMGMVVMCWFACVDSPTEDAPIVARMTATWDPLDCGDPHRVVIELTLEASSVSVSGSVACELGGLAIDVPQLGTYHARAYAPEVGGYSRMIDLQIDRAEVAWPLGDPP